MEQAVVSADYDQKTNSRRSFLSIKTKEKKQPLVLLLRMSSKNLTNQFYEHFDELSWQTNF